MKPADFFSLIRWANQMIIILSMWFIHSFIILPSLEISHAMTVYQFVLLVVSVICITIGGYIINDYFDIVTDNVNKPGKNKIGSVITEKKALNLYYLFTVSGVILGLVLSWIIGNINYGLIFLFTAGILWYYSERYKCTPVLGNMVVAFLSALSFGLVWLFDFTSLQNNAVLFAKAQNNFRFVTNIVYGYMIFAFLSSLFREMIKDMEDYDGDLRMGCNTFVVRYGIEKAKILSLIVGTILFAFLIIVQIFFFTSGFLYVLGFFIIMDAFLIIILKKLKESGDIVDYTNLSDLSKMFMVIGILSMILFYFDLN
jgi:4-hydroxybenzoate polyprenyltransferase